jgi:phage terminase small subunit
MPNYKRMLFMERFRVAKTKGAKNEVDKFTPLQAGFIAAYINNGTEAARQAGYKGNDNTLSQVAHENLRKPKIRKAIEKKLGRKLDALEISSERVLKELALIGFMDIKNILEWGPDGVRLKDSADLGELTKAVASIKEKRVILGHDKEAGKDILKVTTEIKLHNKTKALTKLGEHLKLFTQKHEHTGKDGGPIETRQMSPELEEMLDGVINGVASGGDGAE